MINMDMETMKIMNMLLNTLSEQELHAYIALQEEAIKKTLEEHNSPRTLRQKARAAKAALKIKQNQNR